MSFRTRITLLCAGALLVALGAAGALAYHSERAALEGNLDALVRARAAQVTPETVENALAASNLLPKQRGPGTRAAPTPLQTPAPQGARAGLVGLELVTWVSGRPVALSSASPVIPIDNAARAIAVGVLSPKLRTVMVAGVPSRVYVFRAASGVTGEVAAPLTQVNASLQGLRAEFFAIAAAAVLLVALLAVLVAWQALRPVAALTAAAERVVRTGDLRQRVGTPGRGRDEIGRLAASLNAMLGALERSVTAQRQLVADASHELGTPLTSLSVNLELLDEPDGLTAADARELVAQARGQVTELAALVDALVELARGSEVDLHLEAVRLDLVAATAAERTRRHAPGVSIREHLSPCTVQGDADLLERAIGNLLDNAAKWSRPGGHIDLTVSGGEVIVADEGPGIAAADLPFIFDRFYRSPAARGLPGSGLGLAIVRQVAELHGGRAEADSPERGAILRVRLPWPESRSDPAPAARRGAAPRTGPRLGRLTWRGGRSSPPADL